jgi:hypothetical protein
MNPEIRAAIAAKETQDTKILQKVNAAHREAFREKFPGQIEHCLRLTAERLQACLLKPEGMVLGRPESWPAASDDILNLARSLESLWIIHTEQQDAK